MTTETKRTGWIEPARDDERDMGPYRLCFPNGARYGLSTLDAIRAQKGGAEFKTPAPEPQKPPAPRIVAECWTCCTANHSAARCSYVLPDDDDQCMSMFLDAATADDHRAAGHDVREVTR